MPYLIISVNRHANFPLSAQQADPSQMPGSTGYYATNCGSAGVILRRPKGLISEADSGCRNSPQSMAPFTTTSTRNAPSPLGPFSRNDAPLLSTSGVSSARTDQCWIGATSETFLVRLTAPKRVVSDLEQRTCATDLPERFGRKARPPPGPSQTPGLRKRGLVGRRRTLERGHSRTL